MYISNGWILKKYVVGLWNGIAVFIRVATGSYLEPVEPSLHPYIIIPQDTF